MYFCHYFLQLIQQYIEATKHRTWSNPQLLELWEVDRKGEVGLLFNAHLIYGLFLTLKDVRFSAHDHLVNRRLLWHGTKVAVVAAILKSGLRIMPHSGGRVGKGIYFASENSKSACYGM